MSHYLDSSVALSLFRPDAHSRRVEAWLASLLRPRLCYSHWVTAECNAASHAGARRGEYDSGYGQALAKEIAGWLSTSARRLEFRPEAGELCAELTASSGLKLSAPDALHLALAIQDGATLVTLDERLADAARARNHPVAVPPPLDPIKS